MTTAGEIIRVTLSYTAPGASAGQNVFHYVHEGSAQDDEDTVDTFDSQFTSFWGERWKLLAAANCSLDLLSLDVVNTDGTVARTLGSEVIGTVGTIAGAENAPAAVSAYLLAQTVFPRQRGSKYIPFLSETLMTDGVITVAGLGGISLMLIFYLADIIDGGTVYSPGLLSTTLGAFVPFLPQGATETVPAYQRRRKPNVGI